jgi:hypothetical protein
MGRSTRRTVAEHRRWVASQGGKARARSMTPEELSRAMSAAVAARWRKMTKAQRSETARHAVMARWAKAKKTHSSR